MKLLQRIAAGVAVTPAGNTRRLRYHEMVEAARQLCESLGLSYSYAEVYGLRYGRFKQASAAAPRREQATGRPMLLVPTGDDTAATHAASRDDGDARPSLPPRRPKARPPRGRQRKTLRGRMQTLQQQAGISVRDYERNQEGP